MSARHLSNEWLLRALISMNHMQGIYYVLCHEVNLYLSVDINSYSY